MQNLIDIETTTQNLSVAPTPQHAIAIAQEAANSRRFRIQTDKVTEVTKAMPERECAAIRWLHRHCQVRDLSSEDIDRLLQKKGGGYYSHDSVYQLMTGRRTEQGAQIMPMIEAIEAFKAQVTGTRREESGDFIETRLGRAIWERCEAALRKKRIAFIVGDSQIGKSRNLRAYTDAHNHGETTYVEMPTGGRFMDFRMEMLGALSLPKGMREQDARSRIIASLDPRKLLIIDEAHRCLQPTRSMAGFQSLDFIREIYNRAGCGIVLSLTREGRDLLLNGPHKVALQQLWRRRIPPLLLPASVPVDDLAKFADAHDLEPAPNEIISCTVKGFDEQTGHPRTYEYRRNPHELQVEVCQKEGLGIWLSILDDARTMAKQAKRPISWGAVLKAYSATVAMEEVLR